MIKAIVFDLDGVLIASTKELHFKALNEALKQISPSYVISEDEQRDVYEGLSTRQKLHLLSQHKNVPLDLHTTIENTKQKITFDLLSSLPEDLYTKRRWLHRLKKERGVKLALCTNSIPETTLLLLKKLKLHGDIFDLVLTNADVSLPKPNPEIYNLAQSKLGLHSSECLIVEDSDHGIAAAQASGAFVFRVNSDKDTKYVTRVLNYIERIYPLLDDQTHKYVIPKITIQKYDERERPVYYHTLVCADCTTEHIQETKYLKRLLALNKFSGRCKSCRAKIKKLI